MVNEAIGAAGFTGVGQGQGPKGGKERAQALIQAGIPESIVKQGPQVVKSYAEQNGITLPGQSSQASSSGSLFGFNKAQGSNGANGSQRPNREAMLTSLGIPADVIAQGKSAVQTYAQKNGITLPTPPTQGGNLNFVS